MSLKSNHQGFPENSIFVCSFAGESGGLLPCFQVEHSDVGQRKKRRETGAKKRKVSTWMRNLPFDNHNSGI